MAVKSKDEIMNTLKERFKDSTDDDTLSFLEDISDTYDDMSTRIDQAGDWKAKYEENDKEWRQKYHDRFFNKPKEETDPEPEPDDKPKVLRYEDLFKTE